MKTVSTTIQKHIHCNTPTVLNINNVWFGYLQADTSSYIMRMAKSFVWVAIPPRLNKKSTQVMGYNNGLFNSNPNTTIVFNTMRKAYTKKAQNTHIPSTLFVLFTDFPADSADVDVNAFKNELAPMMATPTMWVNQ